MDSSQLPSASYRPAIPQLAYRARDGWLFFCCFWYDLKSMNMRFFVLLSLLCSSLCFGADPRLLGMPADNREIVINNRILVKVNGKPITVMDVVKKLDVVFYRQFSEYASSSQARFQFYSVNWKQVLNDLIDTELIMADAKECKIEITRGEVRKELEEQFGPQIMMNLDKVGISFDEAWRMIHDDLAIKQMLGLRVHMKARQRVSPSMVRTTYEKYKEANHRPTEWIYRVVTIRGEDRDKGQTAALQLRSLLQDKTYTIEELAQKGKTLEGVDPEFEYYLL